ncbi:hypothetical protein PAHAL_9G133200 [Panicum hallii]|jgi:hypothetical protein|uniref:Uncharacterized protein n=1 Tax=Panicum hallii TaxID=206008 RepID=A0A2T8I159_9POAL|nr:hypothetical protein PAHAL_9G133200 [Panicum hallii]
METAVYATAHFSIRRRRPGHNSVSTTILFKCVLVVMASLTATSKEREGGWFRQCSGFAWKKYMEEIIMLKII